MKNNLEKMAERCWRTSAARFESYRRMLRYHNASTLCVALLSLEIIVINLLVFIPSFKLKEDVITLTTVCLSAFVLVLSLIISQLKYDARANEYHRCAVELANLERKIQIFISSGKLITYEILMGFNGQYASIIKNSNLNHSTIDHDWALIKAMRRDGKCPKSFYEFRKWIWINLKWHIGLSDSIYNLITIAGACTIVIVILFCKE